MLECRLNSNLVKSVWEPEPQGSEVADAGRWAFPSRPDLSAEPVRTLWKLGPQVPLKTLSIIQSELSLSPRSLCSQPGFAGGRKDMPVFTCCAWTFRIPTQPCCPHSTCTENLVVSGSQLAFFQQRLGDLLYPKLILETGLQGGLGQACLLKKATKYEEQGT